eukprot:5474902-Amphidinium_carterae.2
MVSSSRSSTVTSRSSAAQDGPGRVGRVGGVKFLKPCLAKRPWEVNGRPAFHHQGPRLGDVDLTLRKCLIARSYVAGKHPRDQLGRSDSF